MPPARATLCAWPKLLGLILILPKALPRPAGPARALFRLLCLLLTLAASGPAAAASLADLVDGAAELRKSFFGSTERKGADSEALPQWGRLLHHARDIDNELAACLADSSACGTPSLRRWHAAFAGTRGLPRLEQLAAVNDFFNRWPYRSDLEVYGLREYWATPQEFMVRSGDCEDYAIAKFFTLRALGFAGQDLRIVTLRDRLRGVSHAVVTLRLHDEVLVLDSLSDLILPQHRYRQYVARFSMDETSRWQHFGSFRQREPEVFRQISEGGS